ncbi:MAG: hypothetical protein A2583_00495 [Bdellovibrionales bacterium RIFOXYD1_FULL_53_11]|nr:MAG: hypothetical protein A2583_00495 [Bdellovibrionales bacterium RIFOXYD1_FULL_53_11]
MYKLTIVAGPGRGTSYQLQDGETSLGRQGGNTIVLQSSKVSKRHCALLVDSAGIAVKDLGSSNGTFVNGALAKQKVIKPGDRISIGEFVLELSKPQQRQAVAAGQPQTLQLQGIASAAQSVAHPVGMTGSINLNVSAQAQDRVPSDLKGKVIWYFEKFVMPFFYGFTMKQEWKIVCATLFGAFVVGNLFLTVSPLVSSNREMLVKEVGRRALFMAREIVERNAAAIAAGAETKTDIGSIEREEGVRLAVLADMDGRIIAPAQRMNQYFTGGPEAAVAIKARDLFRKGRETGIMHEVDSSTVIAIEPVKVLSQQAGKNVTAGMAIVALDSTLSTMGFGEIGMVYSEVLILTGLLAGLIMFVMFRLTLKPFEVLNDDIDKVLKGEIGQVTHEFRMEELDQLWDIINSTLQRVPKSGGISSPASGGGLSGMNAEDFLGPVKMVGEVARFGIAMCDAEKKMIYLNAMFEEITGIRADNAIGQELSSQARDQAFAQLANDISDRAPAGASISEDFDFSGVSYKIHVGGLGAPGMNAKGYVMTIVKVEG